MNLMLLVVCALMLAILYLGLYQVTEPDRESRIMGCFTLTWLGIGIYLLMTQYLLASYHLPHTLILITAVALAGCPIGKTVTLVSQREFWIEE